MPIPLQQLSNNDGTEISRDALDPETKQLIEHLKNLFILITNRVGTVAKEMVPLDEEKAKSLMELDADLRAEAIVELIIAIVTHKINTQSEKIASLESRLLNASNT